MRITSIRLSKDLVQPTHSHSPYPSHPFHLVTPSPWPFIGCLSAMTFFGGFIMYMHSFAMGEMTLKLGFLMILFTIYVWWRDVIRESTFEGLHTTAVQSNHRMGMLLFITSEVIFFFAFFWAYFHSSTVPSIQIGAIWPPKGIDVFNPWEVPFLNTLILLLSGVTATWSHHCVLAGYRREALVSLGLTIVLAVLFSWFQYVEYTEATFHISDSVYGSCFYMATGFHGFHVQVGTVFLAVIGARMYYGHFSRQQHFGFEASLFYWHFVDVVWLFLFVSIYWWGSLF